MTTHPTTTPRIIDGLGSTNHTPQHLPQLTLAPTTYARTQDCVRCGLCLPTCPTYQITGDEAESPRGRISLIKALADAQIQPSKPVQDHLDHCLDCRACETACPSGVVYHELIEATRSHLNQHPQRASQPRLLNAVIRHLLPHPRRLKLATAPVRIAQKLRLWQLITSPTAARLLPNPLTRIIRMLPTQGPIYPPRLAPYYRAHRNTPTLPDRAAFLEGCAAAALFGDLNRQSIDLLNLAGYDVAVPHNQRCCGALALHTGDREAAQHLARQNIDAFTPAHSKQPALLFITNTAGCGAMLKDYAQLLEDDRDYRDRAAAFADRVRDITEVLAEAELPPPPNPIPITATYHDPCHHAHAQRLTQPPRTLLATIPGMRLVPLTESDTCCGAAGTYNLTQPQMAQQLAQRKLAHLAATGAPLCITANIGCAMHLQAQSKAQAQNTTFTHPITLLHQAYFNNQPSP